jgi:capsular exopolysaccharide synthesis family protein
VEIAEYLNILQRRKWVVVLTLLITVAVVALGIRQIPSTYRATTTLRVLTATVGASSYVQYDIRYSERIMDTYARIAMSGPVLNDLKAELGRKTLPDIQVRAVANTELLQVTVESTDPALAQHTANTMANLLVTRSGDIFIEWAKALPGAGDSIIPTTMGENAVSVVDPAPLPETPVKPNRMLFTALGVIAGLVGGIGLAFLFENLDTRLHTLKQVQSVTHLPLMGQIPNASRIRKTSFLFIVEPYAEAFHRLHINLLSATKKASLHTLLITSIEPAEGKSTISVNLALTMARAGHKVAVVDADLRRPTIHQMLDLPNEQGLSNVLDGEKVWSDVVQTPLSPNLKVLTSGPLPPEPTRLLSSDRMRTTLKRLAKQCDIVLVDTPAFLAVADAAHLASMVDGVLLIVRHDHTRRDAVHEVLQQLAELDIHPLGLVVNRVAQISGYRYYKYYHRQTEAQAIAALQSAHPEQIITTFQEEKPTEDDLKLIRGIGPVFQKSLNTIGIFTFAQLAEEDPEKLARRIGTSITARRICQDGWITQARARLQNGETSEAAPIHEGMT